LAEAPLREWKTRLGPGFPDELARIYSATNGTSGAEDLGMRLLRNDEVLRDSSAIRAHIGLADLDRLFAFWTDDNSNYTAVFLDGPLVGMVGFVDHEEPVPVPVYSSVEAFLTTLTKSRDERWYELAQEYPRATSAEAELLERESELKQLYLSRY